VTIPRLPSHPPMPRGRLMDAETVARDVLQGAHSAQWVKRYVPHKIRLGHRTVRWYEDDVRRYIEELRGRA
jgi:hypothetical protein